ncbi:MAG: ArsC/Spx/MgsR family protein, partial [Bacteroidota bacterium]
MPKIYHLSTCKTCQKVLAQIGDVPSLEKQDIKTDRITPKQLDEMYKLAGSYEALFSRRAMKYRSMGLQNKDLSEDDYKKLILEEYTFLKRPVVVTEDAIFVGSSKKAVAS